MRVADQDAQFERRRRDPTVRVIHADHQKRDRMRRAAIWRASSMLKTVCASLTSPDAK
jgi:hypothetical protein